MRTVTCRAVLRCRKRRLRSRPPGTGTARRRRWSTLTPPPAGG